MAILTPDRFIRPSEVKDLWGLNLLVYGQPGVGKTVFAASAQQSSRGKDVLVIDVESGTRSLGSMDGITIFPVKQPSDLREIYDHLMQAKHTFRTIVIDSISEVQQMYMDEMLLPKMAAGQNPTIQDFGKIKNKMVMLIRNFKAFSTTHGWNIIFTALEDEDVDTATGARLKSPSLSPKTCMAICAIVDGIGRMSMDAKGTRMLQLAQTHDTVAKIRQPANRPQLPGNIVDPTMGKLLDILSGEKPAVVAAPAKQV